MDESSEGQVPSTPSSVGATSQSSEPSPAPSPPPVTPPPTPEGQLFAIGDGVTRAVEGRPYERRMDQPLYRPLKIFALDPSVSRLEGATALVNVPYEPLENGPTGRIFKIEPDAPGDEASQVNLSDPNILIKNGLDPSTTDKQFHNQMVYAVCSVVYTAFRTALGRHITWGFRRKEERNQLIIRPRAFDGNNSHYDNMAGELRFGFFKNKKKDDFPAIVYTCLSHDTIAHKVTHALLDGLRAHFSLPTSADVLGFHEGFADLVAVFQHFSYEQVLRTAIRKSRGVISRATLLTDIARQLGQTSRESKSALRSAIDFADKQAHADDGKPLEPKLYNPGLEPHELGSVLVIAVFEAFIAVFRRKTDRLIRIATDGSGQLPKGDLPVDLQAALAEKASKLASQFLTMCIRAIDYCPPVDISLGEYLRAVITADKDLVPDDPWAYREAWIDAFRRHHIYPSDVPDLSEDSLIWVPLKSEQPKLASKAIKELAFRKLKFSGDPGWPADAKELTRQAKVLGELVTKDPSVFGLAGPEDKLPNGDDVMLPKVQSIRSSRRVGPSGQIVFDIVAELTQKRRAMMGTERCTFYGGSTVIIDPDGHIRYVIKKRVTNQARVEEQQEFLNSQFGLIHKRSLCGTETPNLFQMLHEDDTTTNSK